MALERLLCGTDVAAAEQGILLFADTGIELVVLENFLERMIHAWKVVLERWSESTAMAMALYRMPGIVKEALVILLEAGIVWKVLEILLLVALETLPSVVVDMHAYESLVSTVLALVTQLSRHVSGTMAEVDGNLCEHASHVC